MGTTTIVALTRDGNVNECPDDYTRVVSFISLMDLDPLLIAVLTDV